MMERDDSRIAAINRRVHREVLGLVAQLLEENDGILRDEEGNTSIDVSFMSLLLDLGYDRGEEACTVGATYKQIYRIGYQVDLGKRQMKLWVGFCTYLPLSQKMASHLISNLIYRERETQEAKKLIDEALKGSPEVFEVLNAEDPDNVTFRGDQITPAMARVIEILIDLGEENFVSKQSLVEEMNRLYGCSVQSTNSLLHQLKKRGYIEEIRAEPNPSSMAHKVSTCSRSYRLTAEFGEFLGKHHLHALIRQHLRPR